jgi:hypothetical protein
MRTRKSGFPPVALVSGVVSTVFDPVLVREMAYQLALKAATNDLDRTR